VKSGDELALNELCSRYWYPLYTWLLASRLARGESDAQDMVQGFFQKMLAREALSDHRPEKGRYRTYLLACLKNHVIDQKRKHVPSEPTADEETQEYLNSVLASESADAAYEKAWAWEIFGAGRARLKAEWHAAGQGNFFDAVEPYLEGGRQVDGLEVIGERFGLSHENTRIRIHRLKKQFRDVLTKLILSDLPEEATKEERSGEMQRFFEALVL
jgi:RNA polymerase sigma-70 factor (ECF subfamily)